MNIKELLTDRKIVAVKGDDYNFKIILILDNGLRFTIKANPVLNYKAMRITKNDTDLRLNK